MEAKDLRIGNLLYSETSNCLFDKGIVKVDFNTFQKIHLYNCLKNLKPIPLNEEWLLKFGFRTEESSCFELDDININTSRELMWVYTKCKNNIEIEMPEFVHQLQNLYFALTGKELAKV